MDNNKPQILSFGKYKFKTTEEVYNTEPTYLACVKIEEVLMNSHEDPFRTIVVRQKVWANVERRVVVLLENETTKAGYRDMVEWVDIIVLHKGVTEIDTRTLFSWPCSRATAALSFDEQVLLIIDRTISMIDQRLNKEVYRD